MSESVELRSYFESGKRYPSLIGVRADGDEHETVYVSKAELADAMAENAKLREQLAKARDPQRIGGTADPESFVYAIEQLREFRWQHATNDEEAIPYINNVADAHERENAKLREMALDLYCLAYPSTVEWEVFDAIYDKYSPCEKCCELHGGKSPCASTAKDMAEECCVPIQASVVADRMRELGVEVDG